MMSEEIPETYDELLLLVQPRVIDCDDEYKRQSEWIERILMHHYSSCEPRVRMAELLSVTVMKWEDEVQDLPFPSPRELVLHLMSVREMSQVSLANALGVSIQLVSAIVQGKRAISRAMAHKLAGFFDRPLGDFADDLVSETKPKASSFHTPVTVTAPRMDPTASCGDCA